MTRSALSVRLPRRLKAVALVAVVGPIPRPPQPVESVASSSTEGEEEVQESHLTLSPSVAIRERAPTPYPRHRYSRIDNDANSTSSSERSDANSTPSSESPLED